MVELEETRAVSGCGLPVTTTDRLHNFECRNSAQLIEYNGPNTIVIDAREPPSRKKVDWFFFNFEILYIKVSQFALVFYGSEGYSLSW